MKIVFMGTPETAATALEELVSSQHKIICVVTQPDRPKGRGRKLTFPPIKDVALKYNLPLEQPEKVKNNPTFISSLKSIKPDIIVVVAYGKILPKEILTIPEYGCINVHASLLPKYRGAAPIQWALLKGEKETGITIMKIDDRLDTGDIILQKKIKISDEDNTETLSKKLFAAGRKLLLKALEQIEEGKAKFVKQNEAEATNAPSITKESGELDWRKPALEIHNRVRAMVPWPVAHTFFQRKLLKIWQTTLYAKEAKSHLPGTIEQVVKGTGFSVATGAGAILIREVQAEGKKRMPAHDFVVGRKIKIGDKIPS